MIERHVFPGRKYLIGEFYRDGRAAAVPERRVFVIDA